MANLPAAREPGAVGPVSPRELPLVDDGEIRLRQLVAMLLRNKWLLLACTILGYAAARFYTDRAERVYEAAITLRIDRKQPNLPSIFQTMQRNSDLETDVEVLQSRSLVEEAVRGLALRVKVSEPRDIGREALLDSIQLDETAASSNYHLVLQDDGRFDVYTAGGDQEELVARASPGARVKLDGLSFRLKPGAADYPDVRLEVWDFAARVSDISGNLGAFRVNGEADIVKVHYEDSDPGLVWQVPNVIAERFIERSREARKVEARSQVKFIREQLDTLSRQLAQSEEDLKDFRERARVVSPQVEASSQIGRLVQLESERSSLDAERSSLAKLMAEAEERQARRAPGTPSAYRDLLAFPSLLRSQAASQLLSSLTEVEDQRANLLTRRTEADADVELLTARISELEGHLAKVAQTYLQGLTNQLASLDATAARFERDLRSLPRKELEYGRLERKPAVLKDMYALLQTRLKEAEIAEALESSSISIVDPALPPEGPIRPRAGLLMGAGLVGGLLVAIGLAVVREYSDRTVRSRADVQAVTGLSVMAIIPRIRRRSSRPAFIGRREVAIGSGTAPARPSEAPLGSPPPSPGSPGWPKVSYTFLGTDATAPVQPQPAEPMTRAPVNGGSGHKPSDRALVKPPEVRITVSGLGAAVAEAYAALQTNIAFSRVDDSIKVLVLTSPLPSEGKTTTAVNLSLTLCERGLSVCLIDADMRRGQVHGVFGFKRNPGLSEVLEGKTTFDAAYHQVRVGDFRNLAVLTSGTVAVSPPGLVGSAGMRELLDQLRERFDLIVVDTPPINILTDAALIGVHADGVLLVVRAGATDMAAVSYAMEQLNHVRAPALGVVLNDVDVKRYAAYDGAYKYASYENYIAADADRE
jgi:capsular exopolysaccharide synthesis family protein